MYRIYGVAREEANEPHVQIIDDEYPPSEVIDGIARVTIEIYGDSVDMSFIQIEATDKDKGIQLYNRLVEHWRFELQRLLWGHKDG